MAMAPRIVGRSACRILVVDDYEDTTEAICIVLAMLGHLPRGVASGEAAVAELDDFDPVMVLIDLNLPGMNGYETMHRIRELRQSPPRLIALTGGGLQHDCRSVVERGFDDYLLKPASMETLRRLIDPLARSHRRLRSELAFDARAN
jgi:DNA-binding response OmpR family regulator